MSSDPGRIESRVRAAYEHLAPEPGAEVDLERALGVASQEAAPSSLARRARRLAVPVAASLLAVGAWAWATRDAATPGPESRDAAAGPDGPTADAKTPPTVTLRIAADGSTGYSLTLGADRFTVESRRSFADESRWPETLSDLQQTLRTMVEALAKGDARGPSGLRLVLRPAASARWSWVAWTLQAAAAARISDVVYGSPTDMDASIAQALPTDGGAQPPGTGEAGVTVDVVLFALGDDACDRVRERGVDVKVVVRSVRRIEAGTYRAGAALPADPRRGPTLDAVAAAVRTAVDAAIASGATLACVVEAPPPGGACVPYGAVFDVLAVLRAAGVADVRLAGVAAPRAWASQLSAREIVETKRVKGVRFEGTVGDFATFARTVTGLEVRVPDAARGASVTVELADGTVAALLDAACASAGWRWELLDRTIHLRPTEGGGKPPR